jgi:hypothetical protein
MALAETTLSAACGANDRSITVASATSLAAGRLIEIDGEVMQVTKDYVAASTQPNVTRGLNGTAQKAHPSGARVTHGEATDFGDPAPGTSTNFPAAGLAFKRVSYSASGAIELPEPGSMRLAMLNGTSVLAMTLAVPTKAMDGVILFVVGNGKAAHTLTVSGGIGAAGASYDVATFDANGQNAVMLIAANEVWVLLSPMTGTLTAVVPAIA